MKKTLNEQILGTNFQFRYHNLKVGSTFSWHHYQYSFAPSTELYKQENLKGQLFFSIYKRIPINCIF